MIANLTISDASLAAFSAGVEARLKEVQPKVELKMAETFLEVVLSNFGATGAYRPFSWHDLSPSYAKKVGRTYATLEVSGRLKNSVRIGLTEGGNFEVAVEDSDVPYATGHQLGRPRGNRGHPGLPAREFFPMDEDGEVMRPVQDLVVEQARQAFVEVMT